MLTRDQKNQNSLNLFLNTYFNIIVVFILSLALTAAYLIVIQPKYQETMTAIQTNIEQQQTLLIEQQKNLANLKVVSELYGKIPAGDLEKFNEVLPNNYVKERLFGELDEIISQSGFIVQSISLDKSSSGNEEGSDTSIDKTGTVNLRLDVSAIDYAGLKRALRLLENNLRLFDIKELSFSAGGNSVNLVLSTYYYNK